MSAKHRCNRDGSQKGPYPVDSLMPANVCHSPRALLAAASLIVLAALGAPSAAWAAATPPSRPSPGRLRARSSATAGQSRSRAAGTSLAVPTATLTLDCASRAQQPVGRDDRRRQRRAAISRSGRHGGADYRSRPITTSDQQRHDRRRKRRHGRPRTGGPGGAGVSDPGGQRPDQQRRRSAAEMAASGGSGSAARAARACRTPGRSRR